MSENSRINLDATSIRSRIGTRSSMTDLNQIYVFTDEFEEQKEKIEDRQQMKKSDLEAKIFFTQIQEKNGGGITDFLFQEQTEQKIVRTEPVTNHNNLPYLGGSLLTILFILLLSALFLFRKKGKEKHDADNQFQTIT